MARTLTIKDFEIRRKDYENGHYVHYIDHLTLQHVMGDVLYKRYCDWARGQTCIAEGDYPCDVEAFLHGQQPLD